MKLSFLILASVFIFAACDDGCTFNEERCNGDVLETCSEENTWVTIYDCSDWEDAETGEPGGFVCCNFEDLLDCWLPEECEE